ncbi:unnamed protein product, partial [Meganyctiphanes norvegica]
MEENECIVCFSRYDDKEQRPRVLHCGHTLCSKCLKTAIRGNTKMCPKCIQKYSALNVKDLPVNFSLENMMKSANTSDKLPECAEHQLLVSHRCFTHKAWVCQSCLKEDHSSEACTIITINEQLDIKKSTQLAQCQPFIDAFREICQRSNDCKKQCQKRMEENYEEILRNESIIKRL